MRIAVLGAGGAAGRACLSELETRGHQPIALGREEPLPVDIDAAILAVPPEVAQVVESDALLVDCSGGLPRTTLCLPGVTNPGDVRRLRIPNCTATLIAIALVPLRTFGIKSVTATTLQAASGAGWRGVEALQAGDTESIFGGVLQGNILPHERAAEEESEVAEQLHALLDCAAMITAFRVPVRVGHVASIMVETEEPCPNDLLPDNNLLDPLSLECKDDVATGRVRIDGLRTSLVACCDQLHAATAVPAVNAVLSVHC
ncbi:MAG: Asd/ArgC dimerization domain-containing protein [Phycisphaerales bacterium]|jgi:hypothetical protein|nr:Asd/ArgC dimerization domain-containing protein [Phycisphaerales bacterium]